MFCVLIIICSVKSRLNFKFLLYEKGYYIYMYIVHILLYDSVFFKPSYKLMRSSVCF